MPRHPRKMETSSYFHVIVQGIEKKYIFEKLKYKTKYYELLITRTEKFNIKMLAYCIMDNHAHMIMYTENIENLGLCMKSINTSFAQIYNNSEKRVGYVFRNRFASEPIMSEKQLYMCMAYIHFNPVKAGMVKKPEQYSYSSYNDYVIGNNIGNSENINLLFGAKNDYLEIFYLVHTNYSEYKVFEKAESLKDIKKSEKIIEKEKIKEKCLELKKQNVSIRKIAEKLNFSKSEIQRLLK